MDSRLMEGRHGFLSRRGFIRLMSASAASVMVPACSEEQEALGRRPEARRVTPYITPNQDFYLVAVDPDYRPPLDMSNVQSQWHLNLRGADGTSVDLSFNDLMKRASATVPYTFECIGNRVGGQLIGHALWHVVPLKTLLREAGVLKAQGASVMFTGLDDFYSSVSMARVLDDYAFIAMRMNGEPLPSAHGFPARVILPDLYGMKQPRWLHSIEVQETDETTSYWEKRGWAGEVPIKTMSRLDPRQTIPVGQPQQLTGVAFAGARGITAVEVSLDDGATWRPCQLTTAQQPNVWSLWRYRWDDPTSGRHTLQVRAVDGNGDIQTAQRQKPRPDGASGYHTMDVRVA